MRGKRTLKLRLLFSCLVLFLLAGAPVAHAPGSPGNEYYYVMVFGSQRPSANPYYSHTFATFVRATEIGPQQFVLQSDTISWSPTDGVIRINSLFPEQGVNLDLRTTLDWALRSRQRVSMWGPYQIHPDLYCRALAQKAFLESGSVQYKAKDARRFTDRITNCAHAVSAVAEGHRMHLACFTWGENASYDAVCLFEPWFINPAQKHPWISSALGLDCYPIVRRELEPPRTGPIRSVLRIAD